MTVNQPESDYQPRAETYRRKLALPNPSQTHNGLWATSHSRLSDDVSKL